MTDFTKHQTANGSGTVYLSDHGGFFIAARLESKRKMAMDRGVVDELSKAKAVRMEKVEAKNAVTENTAKAATARTAPESKK